MTREQVRAKPIYQLSLAELDLLSDEERTLAVGLMVDMKRDGSLAMLSANPPGTRYEVVADRQLGWAMKPVCTCGQPPEFIAAYFDYRPDDSTQDRSEAK